MTRGVSTVLDASVCLLLVSASALALVGVPTDGRSDPDTADEAAETLAASTARVTDDEDRTVHGTLAGLLATAAVKNAATGGSRLLPGRGFESAVETEVRRELRRAGGEVQVVARWKPVPDSRLGGRVVAGATPPPDADVHAATFSVASGLPSVRERALTAARRDGFAGVGRAVVRGVARGLFPPGKLEVALDARPARAHSTVERYREAARTLGVAPAVERALRAGNATRANRALADALGARVESALREEFDSPLAAARAIEVSRVRVTVRTWSA